MFTDAPLSLYGMLEDTIVDYESILHLTCPVYTGGRNVITEWYKDSKLIKFGHDMYFTTTSYHKDSGVYHCVVILDDNRVMSNAAIVTVKGNVVYFGSVVVS